MNKLVPWMNRRSTVADLSLIMNKLMNQNNE